jgi:hypothetical protein
VVFPLDHLKKAALAAFFPIFSSSYFLRNCCLFDERAFARLPMFFPAALPMRVCKPTGEGLATASAPVIATKPRPRLESGASIRITSHERNF